MHHRITLRVPCGEELEGLRNDFIANDFFIIRQCIDLDTAQWLQESIAFTDGFRAEPTQFFREHGHGEEIELMHNLFTPIVNLVTFPKRYFRTYGFGILYVEGSELLPHLDLVTNELSATLVFAQDAPYPMYVDKQYQPNTYNARFTTSVDNIPRKQWCELDLRQGDIGVFNGRNHFHFREKLSENINYKGLLMHWSTCVEYLHSSDNLKDDRLCFVKDMEAYAMNSTEVPEENSLESPLYGAAPSG
jgi:hypothetical protein